MDFSWQNLSNNEESVTVQPPAAYFAGQLKAGMRSWQRNETVMEGWFDECKSRFKIDEYG